MSRDLDTRGRSAAAGLLKAVDTAQLSPVSPAATPSRKLALGLRPALVLALLMAMTAIGVALVSDSSETPPSPVVTTAPSTPTTVAAAPAEVVEPAPPTTAYVVPPTSATTVAADTTPPLLVITSPEDGAEMEQETITFTGETEPGASVFAGPYEADVDAQGHWQIVLILNAGSNVARFTATDQAGNQSEAAVTVYYVVEKPTTTTTVKELAEYTAFSVFGSCSEDPPYDVYHGTGVPGTLISISSEYGSAVVEVGEKGEWEKKVIFEAAPPDKPFVVTISDQFGRTKKFEFVYLPA